MIRLKRWVYPCSVEQVVGAGGLDDLGLLLHSEVGPCELRVDVLLVQLQDLVVTDRARVCVVHDPRQTPSSHLHRQREELWQHCHRVRDVDDLHGRRHSHGQTHWGCLWMIRVRASKVRNITMLMICMTGSRVNPQKVFVHEVQECHQCHKHWTTLCG
jgi:hypothetical protein